MKLELKNVKRAAFASRETDCFTATVYIDGVKAGEVENDGQGGPNNYHPHSLQTRLDAYAKTLPKIECSDCMLDQDADCVIGDVLGDYLERQSLKRLCAKKTMFRKPGEQYKRGEYHTVKAKFDERVRAFLVGKYGPDVEILNATI